MLLNQGRQTPVVLATVIAVLIVFGLQMSGGHFLFSHFALWPPGPRTVQYSAQGAWQYPSFQVWQLLSYAFLHGGAMHLMFNLFGLWMFGAPVERALGSRRFLLFYGVCVVGAALAQILAAQTTGKITPAIGASGGVMGLLPAFALLYPQARIQLLFPPIGLKAPVFVLVYGAVELLLGLTNTLPGIAHFAHLGGMLCGAILLAYWLWLAPRHRKPE